jgi:hypothetical protein
MGWLASHPQAGAQACGGGWVATPQAWGWLSNHPINVSLSLSLFGSNWMQFSRWGFFDLLEFNGKTSKGNEAAKREWWVWGKGPFAKNKEQEFEIGMKLASQAMKKAVVPPRCTKERLRGRRRKRKTIGITERSLGMPLQTNFPMP